MAAPPYYPHLAPRLELVIAKQPPSAANACSAKTEALRIELQGLKFSALRKRATAAGADEDDMDAVDDSDDPKTKLVELVIAKAAIQSVEMAISTL